MKSCLIITGGRLDLSFAGPFCKNNRFDKIIAVDGGLEAVKALGLMPDMIVGDFDTAKQPLIEEFRRLPFIIWDVHEPEKNETDTELALRKAAAFGCTHITILGATGGRFDHMLANVFLLYGCLQQGIRACILDAQNKIYVIDEPYTFRRSEQWGTYLSFLPLLGEIKGITLEGFKYPLTDYDLEAASSRCISNELAEETGTIRFREGVAICVESKD
ncbi:MAG: thiamine diphosphokinase [Lachnospiraceae bacterium]|nr:thiamine diphosphokinase [Lachnospiraceae bacterium]